MTAYRLALATLVATFALLLVGGTVNPTGSSLACPDWPLCYGEVLPEFQGGVQYEHSHRLAGAAVGLCSILLVLVTFRTAGVARRTRRLVLLLLGMVIVQGVLGGITVLLRLATLVSTAHLALSMAFFLLVMTAAAWLRPGAGLPGAESLPRGTAVVALVATYAQIVLGGFIRHVGAGRACGTDFPTCGGEWWPELWAARTHMLHRFAGIVVGLVIVACAVIVARRAHAAGRRLVAMAALATPPLIVAQVLLGVLVVRTGIGFWPIMGHFTVAILLLASWQACVLGLGPSGALAPEPAGARAVRVEQPA